jgi:hypothetical protein
MEMFLSQICPIQFTKGYINYSRQTSIICKQWKICVANVNDKLNCVSDVGITEIMERKFSARQNIINCHVMENLHKWKKLPVYFKISIL